MYVNLEPKLISQKKYKKKLWYVCLSLSHIIISVVIVTLISILTVTYIHVFFIVMYLCCVTSLITQLYIFNLA